MLTLKVEGLKQFSDGLTGLARRVDAAGYGIVAESAAVVEARAKRNFAGAHRKGQPHVGGNRPNIVTGMLRRSIMQDPVTRDGMFGWSTRVGPTAVYGRRVELGYAGGGGGRGHQRTRPFPYLAPARDQSLAALGLIAQRRWSQAI